MGDNIFTDDAIFHGALRLRQRKGGYRFTEDAVLLAAFVCQGPPVSLVADWGTGCGVVGLMLLHQGWADRVVALELQPALAQLARHNGRSNGWVQRFVVLGADLCQPPLRSASLPLIVSNPPHFPVGQGQVSPCSERALARHELACSLSDLAHSARRCLAPTGRLVVVYPGARLGQLRSLCAEAGLFPGRVQQVLPRPGQPASLVLVELVLADRGLPLEMAPLVTRRADGSLSEEMEELLAGRWPTG